MWVVIEYAETVQVIPGGDLKRHDLDNCECIPKLQNGVYVHNSFDGREENEIDKESLKS